MPHPAPSSPLGLRPHRVPRGPNPKPPAPPRSPPACVPHPEGTPTVITLSWLLIIALAGGVLALIDGVLRLRGKGGTLFGIIETVIAALFLLSHFVPGIPFGSVVLGVATIVVLVIGLILRAKHAIGITLAALLVIAFWIVLVNRWLIIPGVN